MRDKKKTKAVVEKQAGKSWKNGLQGEKGRQIQVTLYLSYLVSGK